MWKITILLFIKNLFTKRKVYEKYVHVCYAYDFKYSVNPKYTYGGSLGNKGLRLRYNVYEVGKCTCCNKHYRHKVATNISSARLYTKFNIKL